MVTSDISKLGTTFVRFQEHYESPEFRGKVFTRAEFRKWYTKSKGGGGYTYNYDWAGYNVPDCVFVPFFEGKFNPLVRPEKELLSHVNGLTPPFYVVGVNSTTVGVVRVLRHEVAHALWYLDSEYRKEARDIVCSLPAVKKQAMTTDLLAIGYCESTLEDEIHAYLLEPPDRHSGTDGISKMQKQMETLFSKCFPKINNCMERIKKETPSVRPSTGKARARRSSNAEHDGGTV